MDGIIKIRIVRIDIDIEMCIFETNFSPQNGTLALHKTMMTTMT